MGWKRFHGYPQLVTNFINEIRRKNEKIDRFFRTFRHIFSNQALQTFQKVLEPIKITSVDISRA